METFKYRMKANNPLNKLINFCTRSNGAQCCKYYKQAAGGKLGNLGKAVAKELDTAYTKGILTGAGIAGILILGGQYVAVPAAKKVHNYINSKVHKELPPPEKVVYIEDYRHDDSDNNNDNQQCI